MSPIRVIAVLVVTLAGLPALAQQTGRLAPPDKEVLQQMAENHLAAIEAGRLGAQNATRVELKQLAVDMVQGQRDMLNQVVGVTQSYGEQQPFAPSVAQRGALVELAGLSGTEFDRQFLSGTISRLEEALEIAERTAGEAANSDVKTLAERSTSYLRLQLDAARRQETTPTASARK
jgi:predicted outer membrane protein